MNNQHSIFETADILIPEEKYLDTWSVIACDQFSSQPEYWERVRNKVGERPSTLNMIIPEAYLVNAPVSTESKDYNGAGNRLSEAEQADMIASTMQEYIKQGFLREFTDSFIYTQRTLPDGRIRQGIVGALNLDDYDFRENNSKVRASEGTILERLPARAEIRKKAVIELPHIIAFIDDKDSTVFSPLSAQLSALPEVYNFNLMEGGGHISGRLITGDSAETVRQAITRISAQNDIAMIIGDGNHSLAAAKVYWDGIKQNLSESEKTKHPAGRALVEVCDVYDSAVDFEAIHRVIYNVDAQEFIKTMKKAVPQGDDFMVRYCSAVENGYIGIKADCIGTMLVLVQGFIDEYLKDIPQSSIDYIHGAEHTEKLSQTGNCVGLILPAMSKSDLFETVALRGVFPRKSFSVGRAAEKRYYLECRRIKGTSGNPERVARRGNFVAGEATKPANTLCI